LCGDSDLPRDRFLAQKERLDEHRLGRIGGRRAGYDGCRIAQHLAAVVDGSARGQDRADFYLTKAPHSTTLSFVFAQPGYRHLASFSDRLVASELEGMANAIATTLKGAVKIERSTSRRTPERLEYASRFRPARLSSRAGLHGKVGNPEKISRPRGPRGCPERELEVAIRTSSGPTSWNNVNLVRIAWIAE